jgi:hypothetical protein
VLHDDWSTTGCEAHTNFAKESACLRVINIPNEVVTIHRSQEVLKILSLYTQISFTINCFIKRNRYNNPSCTYITPDSQLSLDGAGLHGLDEDSVNSSSNYFEYLCIPASETTLHQKRVSTADRSHLRQQTVDTNGKNEPCYLDHAAARRG